MFLYGIELYMFCSSTQRSKLEHVYRKCGRVVLNDTLIVPSIPVKEVYKRLNILPLRLLFQLQGGVFMYNAVISRHNELFEDTFQWCPRKEQTQTLLQLPIIHCERDCMNVAFWGAKLWNSIPREIRAAHGLHSFSQAYHAYLHSKVDSLQVDNYDLLDFV